MKAILTIAVCVFLVSYAAAQQSRPTAVQILAQQLAAVAAQNAELIEKVGQLEDRIAKMIQERSQPQEKK